MSETAMPSDIAELQRLVQAHRAQETQRIERETILHDALAHLVYLDDSEAGYYYASKKQFEDVSACVATAFSLKTLAPVA